MEAQITTRYRARYAVTILGTAYEPGDEITDPKIDGKVLKRLSDNNRVTLVPHVHVPYANIAAAASEFDPDEPDEDDDQDDDQGEDEPEGDEGDPPTAAPGLEAAAQAAVKAATQAAAVKPPIPAGAALNAAWKASFAKHRHDGETLKGYLQRVLQENAIKATGPVQELVTRLATAGVQPGVAGH